MVFYISAQASPQLQTLLPPLLQCQDYGLPPLAFSSHVANIFHTGPLKPNDGDLNQADLSYPGPLGFQQAPQLGGLSLKQELKMQAHVHKMMVNSYRPLASSAPNPSNPSARKLNMRIWAGRFGFFPGRSLTLCSPGWPGPHHAAQVALKLTQPSCLRWQILTLRSASGSP